LYTTTESTLPPIPVVRVGGSLTKIISICALAGVELNCPSLTMNVTILVCTVGSSALLIYLEVKVDDMIS